jgi:hypothetical protein
MSRLDRTVATMTEAGAATPAKELVSLADTTFSTGLIERSAAAFASGVPEGAGGDGFFGPASVAWRMSADLASPVAGLRSLLMQALHPLAMAGVDQHSGWRRDPVGRLGATSRSASLTHVPRSARRARGAAADHPADALGAAHMKPRGRQQLVIDSLVRDPPADPRTWPPHRDDVLIVPRTGHVKCDAGRTPSAASC